MWHFDKIMNTARNDNAQATKTISFFDVKELYDCAFAEKEKRKAAILMARAEKLDAAYRAQLAKPSRPFSYQRAA